MPEMPETKSIPTELPDDVQHDPFWPVDSPQNVCKRCGTIYLASATDTPCPAKIFAVMSTYFKLIAEGMAAFDDRVRRLESLVEEKS